MKNTITGFLLILLIFLTYFYYWGSSPVRDESFNEYYRTFFKDKLIQNKDTITIVSYNIGYLSGMTNNLPMDREKELFETNERLSIELLMTLNADIIATQEIDFDANRSFNINQQEHIAQALYYANGLENVNWNMNYVPFPYWPLSMQFGQIVSGQSLMSNFKIHDYKRYVLKKPESAPFWYQQFYIDRLVQHSQLLVNEDTLHIFNVHLEAFDRETREKQSLELIEIVKPWATRKPVILLGDFNAMHPFETFQNGQPIESTVPNILSQLNFVEAFSMQEYNTMLSMIQTYPSDSPYEKIDHIFYSKQFIQAISAEVPQEKISASDHRPVLFRFRINKF